MKLYMVQTNDNDDYNEYGDPMPQIRDTPEGWDEYCLEKWGEPREFFMPSTSRVYRSRSSAQDRVDLVNRWGGNATLVEADVEWVPSDEARRRRRLAALDRKRAEMAARLEEIDKQICEEESV